MSAPGRGSPFTHSSRPGVAPVDMAVLRAIALAAFAAFGASTVAPTAPLLSADPVVCLSVMFVPQEVPMYRITVRRGEEMRLRYRHSVTLTPVEERYSLEGHDIRQTEIRFVEHGPGLPTQADAAPGASWSREDGQFVMRMSRTFASITMRVDPGQSPTLVVRDFAFSESHAIDLAQSGRRALRIESRPGGCDD